jgi:UDP-3-O-[3-hydroxymyristoyl] glucosamine N-acyltransferase
MKYRLGDIAKRLGLELIGEPSIEIEGIASLLNASEKQISFLSKRTFAKDLLNTRAAAVILSSEFKDQCASAKLISDNPYLSFAELTALFDVSVKCVQGIHPSSVIDNTASVDSTVTLGPNVVVGANVTIAANCIIEANTVIADNCVIGENCHIYPNVTLYHSVKLGSNVNIHSSTVIGADGFGFAPNSSKAWTKIHQLGGVSIGNNVDIGANTCIDRGALEDTVIANGVIIDNQVQIAHNCVIGENTAIAGCVGIAGSTIIGKNCTLAGGVGIAGHLEITDNVHVTSMSLVTGSILEAGSYSSGTAMMQTKLWRKSAVRFTQLDKMFSQIKKIQKKD